jgi:hypothetical protein
VKAYRVLTGNRYLPQVVIGIQNRQLLCVHAGLPPYRKLRRFVGNGLRYYQLAESSAFRFHSLPFPKDCHPNNPQVIQ